MDGWMNGGGWKMDEWTDGWKMNEWRRMDG